MAAIKSEKRSETRAATMTASEAELFDGIAAALGGNSEYLRGLFFMDALRRVPDKLCEESFPAWTWRQYRHEIRDGLAVGSKHRIRRDHRPARATRAAQEIAELEHARNENG